MVDNVTSFGKPTWHAVLIDNSSIINKQSSISFSLRLSWSSLATTLALVVGSTINTSMASKPKRSLCPSPTGLTPKEKLKVNRSRLPDDSRSESSSGGTRRKLNMSSAPKSSSCSERVAWSQEEEHQLTEIIVEQGYQAAWPWTKNPGFWESVATTLNSRDETGKSKRTSKLSLNTTSEVLEFEKAN